MNKERTVLAEKLRLHNLRVMPKILTFRGLLLFGVCLLLVVVAASFFQTLSSKEGQGTTSSVAEQQLAKRLAIVYHELYLLKRQNAELRLLCEDVSLIRNLKEQELRERFNKVAMLLENSTNLDHNDINGIYLDRTNNTQASLKEPSLEYEQTRRRLENGVIEMWYFFGSELRKLQKLAQNSTDSSQLETINHILEQGVEHKRSLLQSVERLARVDGYSEWRTREAQELSELVQRRLHHLQNPPDCATARKLLCKLDWNCGFGCQIHHVTACFIEAYASQSTMVLSMTNWNYNNSAWQQFFMNISVTCSDPKGAVDWPGNHGYAKAAANSSFLPLAVPRDLASRLSRLHGDPIVWWVGQFQRYLLRPQPALSQMLVEAAGKLNFRKPVVGIHVRRTDKKTEAAFYPVQHYMAVVDEYFSQLELSQPVDKRRVYLASDEPSVHEEARRKFPNYEFLGDKNMSLAAAVNKRYHTDDSLRGILTDIHFLSSSDFLVCTHSSNVCRLAYEIMQQLHPDAASKVRSLDHIYFYDGQLRHHVEVVIEHQARRPREIDLKVGDIVSVGNNVNQWNGYSWGTNTRTGRVGLFPTYKVEDRMRIADFPKYPEVDILSPAPRP